MREYLLVWRALPKLLVGCLFLSELALLISGPERFQVVSALMWTTLLRHFSGATLLIVIILLTGVVAGLGLFLLRVTSAVARVSGRTILRLVSRRFKERAVPLRELFEAPYKTALRLFRERSAFYLRSYELKSSSFAVESLEKVEEISQHWASVKAHVMEARHEDIEATSFYSMLSQDRRAYEIIDGEIQSYEDFIIVLLLAPAAVGLLGIEGWSWVTILLVVLSTAALLLPEIATRRRFLALYSLAAYLDLFTVHQGADVADREGEPYI